MRDNLMIRRFKELPNENLMEDVSNAIKNEFVPHVIVGKLENYQKKEEILKIQQDLRRASKSTDFCVSEQFPAAAVVDRGNEVLVRTPA